MSDYVIHIRANGIDMKIAIQDEEDLAILNAALDKLKRDAEKAITTQTDKK